MARQSQENRTSPRRISPERLRPRGFLPQAKAAGISPIGLYHTDLGGWWARPLTSEGPRQICKLSLLLALGLALSALEIGPVVSLKPQINLWPILFVTLLLIILRRHNNWAIQASLFFSISAFTALGFAETLTGSHAEGTSPLIFGLSFYTASLAYHASKGSLSKFGPDKILALANPLFLFTGPILTHFRTARISARAAYVSLSYMILGFFMFFVIAKNLTPFLSLRDITSFWDVIIYGVIFELFVYFNFCGLSLAIYGTARLFGFQIPLNFRQPFSATNIVEFWRGWHITLSAVLKELFYEKSKKHVSSDVAIFVVFVASAMWHGMTPNFLLWGLFHATMFVVGKHLLKRRQQMLALGMLFPTLILGRIFFSENRTDLLLEKIRTLVSLEGIGLHPAHFYSLALEYKTSLLCLLLGIAFIAIEIVDGRTRSYERRRYNVFRTQAAIFALMILIFLIGNTGGGDVFAVYGQR